MPCPCTTTASRNLRPMSDLGRSRVEVRAVLSEPQRAGRVRGLVVAVLACAALVVAVVVVGLSAGWPVWALILVILLPLAIGLLAARTAYALHRHPAGPASG